MATSSKPIGSLGELIEAKRDEIVQRWAERARQEIRQERGLSRSTLVDSLPDFLRELASLLRRQASTGAVEHTAEVGHIAEEHGRQRHQVRADVNTVVWEYGLLRQVIFDLVEEVGLEPRLDEHRVLEGALTTGVSEALRHLVQERERDLREAELRLRRIAESGIVGVVEWRLSGPIVAANDTFLEMVGYTRDDLEAGRLDFRKLTPPEHQLKTDRSVESLQGTGVVPPFEKQYFRKDGSRVDVLVSGATLDEANGIGIALILDISRRKRLEAERERLLAEALEAARMREEMIGVISHDLRNPLSAIAMSAASLLRREHVDARTATAAARIQAAAERATGMILELLDFTQARSAGIPVSPQPMDLGELARQLVDEARLTHPERRVDLDVVGDASGRWDPGRAGQVLGNLIGNALQHSPPGTPVSVTVTAEGPGVVVEVHNEGPPIPSDLLPRIFEPFSRGPGRASDGASGIGLGLYSAHQIVQAHAGRIEVRSTAEEGTTFRVWFPRQPHRREAAPAQPGRAPL